MKLGHVSLFCSDLELSKDFYLNTFDMSVSHTFVNDAGGIYGYFLDFPRGGRIELFLNEETPKSNEHSLIDHFCVEVFNLEHVLSRVSTIRIKSGVRVGRSDGVKQAVLIDPCGVKIELHQVKQVKD